MKNVSADVLGTKNAEPNRPISKDVIEKGIIIPYF
jgi:hypothetical protein